MWHNQVRLGDLVFWHLLPEMGIGRVWEVQEPWEGGKVGKQILLRAWRSWAVFRAG